MSPRFRAPRSPLPPSGFLEAASLWTSFLLSFSLITVASLISGCGGAVQGQDMYGQYPILGVNQQNDVGAGRLIPTTAVEQYAGTLASWFGLSDSQVRTVFPNFGNFGTDPYLGFMA